VYREEWTQNYDQENILYTILPATSFSVNYSKTKNMKLNVICIT